MKKKPINNSNGFDEWGGYMEAKKRKLEEQFELEAKSDTKRGGIFQGIAIFVNGYTIPSAEELKALMLLHGGVYHHYESSRTTHIIASNLPHTKLKKLKGGEKIVKPEWIVDSIEKTKLLDYKKYLLFVDNKNAKPLSKLLLKGCSNDSEFSKSSQNSRFEKEELTKLAGNSFGSSNTLVKPVEKSNLDTFESPCCSKSLVENSALRDDGFDRGSNSNESKEISSTHKSTVQNPADVINTNGLKSRDSNGKEPVDAVHISSIKFQDSNVGTRRETEVKRSSNTVGCSSPKPQDFDITSLDAINISAPKPQAVTKNASNEDFLDEFYNKSRLHHLSTMGATFKQYVNELRDKHDGEFQGRKLLRDWKTSLGNKEREDVEETFSENPNPTPEPVIMHIDMDCFFVSVGMRNRPELKDAPVAVAHGKGNSSRAREGVDRQAEFDIYRQRTMERMGMDSENHTRFQKVNAIGELDSMSEIASCNYKAREFGLKNGMFVGSALKMCPNLKIVPYDFEGYKEVSYCLYNLIASLTLNIEAVSCDEMYVDCSQLLEELGLTPLQFATYLRETILKETGCSCSTGFGSNRLQARLATKKAKPNGQFHLSSEMVSHFMLNIPLSDLPGVGHSLLFKLNALGAQTCGDLQRISLSTLQNEMGNKNGLTLYNHCRGLDDKELTFEHQRKSVSAEVNYGIRFQDSQEMETFVKQLSREVEKRLDEVKLKGKCVTLKLMVRSAEAPREASKFLGHGVCDYITKSASLPMHISQASQIYKEVMSIASKLKVDPKELRGVGIQVSKLEARSKTLTTIDTFFTNRTKPPDSKPGSSSSMKVETSSNDEQPKLTVITEPKPTSFQTTDPKPGPSHAMSPTKKLIFVPDTLVKSPKRKTIRSPKKNSPQKALGNIKSFLMKAQTKTQVPEDFDRSVFESLPEDIKREVLRSSEEQRTLLKSSTPASTRESLSTVTVDNLDQSFLNALPEDIRAEVLGDLGIRSPEIPTSTKTSVPAVNLDAASTHVPSVITTSAKIPLATLTADHLDAASTEEPLTTVTANNLDKSFLNELPEDIRQEVLEDLRRQQSVEKKTIPKLVENDPRLSNETRESPKQVGVSNTSPILDTSMLDTSMLDTTCHVLNFNASVDEMRSMLREWLSESRPEPGDVEMFSDYLRRLVDLRQLSTIVILLRFLNRHVDRKQSGVWSEAYRDIESSVQVTMKQKYGKELSI